MCRLKCCKMCYEMQPYHCSLMWHVFQERRSTDSFSVSRERGREEDMRPNNIVKLQNCPIYWWSLKSYRLLLFRWPRVVRQAVQAAADQARLHAGRRRPRPRHALRQRLQPDHHLQVRSRKLPIETFVQAFPPVNIDVFDAAFTQVFVLVVCLGVLACCLCRSVTVIVTT